MPNPNSFGLAGLAPQNLEEIFQAFEAPQASAKLPTETGFAEGQPERRDPFDVTAGTAGPQPEKPPREMPGPPGTSTGLLAEKEAGLDAVTTPAVETPTEVATIQPPQQQQLPQDPVEGQTPELDPMAELEKRWLDMYDIGAKDLVGEETYTKLKQLSEKKMTTGQIIALMGVFATNPEAGQRYVEQFNQEKSDALSILANLERDTVRFKREGMAQYAQTKREELKLGQRQTVEDQRIEAKEYQQRVAMSEDMLSEVVTQQGLPASVVNPPTPEQLRDANAFWSEWVPEFSHSVGTYIGKQNINKWLFEKEGPSWLMQSALVDPANGVMHRLRETGLYKEEELQIMGKNIIPEFTKSVLRGREVQEAKLHKIDADILNANRLADLREQEIALYTKKLERMDELSPAQRVTLMNDLSNTKVRMLQSQAKHMQYAAWMSDQRGGEETYGTAIATNINAASQLDAQLEELELMEMKIKEEIGAQSMLVEEAIPESINESVNIIMQYHQGLFDSPQSALDVFFGEEDPQDPLIAQARRNFYINLLLLVQMKSHGNIHNVATLMNMGGPGESALDVAAGQDVTMPPEVATMAAGQAAQAGE